MAKNRQALSLGAKFRHVVSCDWPWAVTCAVMVFAAAVRFRLAGVPLERDEGEYAYAGQLILQGVPPFSEIYNMKMPGIYGLYAVILAVFGESPMGIHLGLAVMNAATCIVIFFLARHLMDSVAGVVSAAWYGIFSLSPKFLGLFAHAEHFVVFFAVLGVLLLLRAMEKDRLRSLFLSGVLLGTAFIVKQNGLPFALFALVYASCRYGLRSSLPWRKILPRVGLLIVGIIAPWAVTSVVLWLAGVFDHYWFWTFTYAAEYGTRLSFGEGRLHLTHFLKTTIEPSLPMLMPAIIGLSAIFWNRSVRRCGIFLAGFAAFSILAVCLGLYFREHYFLLFLPALSLFSGLGTSALAQAFSESRWASFKIVAPIALVVAPIFHFLYTERSFLFYADPVTASRMVYGLNPFPESLAIGEFIKEHSSPTDTIAILGSEPQIFFYAQRRSATSYVYVYPLVEPQPFALKMQEEMISQIEEKRPRFLLLVHIDSSWLFPRTFQAIIFDWLKEYRKTHYRLAGLVQLGPEQSVSYDWNPAQEDYPPKGTLWIAIFERKD